MSKKALVILIIAIAAVIGIGATAYTVSTGVFDPYEQQIKLGYKLLAEGQYEEAILAFDKAISIESKRDKAYIGKADTYFAENNTDMVALINKSLTAGYELTQSEKIINTYIKFADDLIAMGKTELALELLRLGYETTGDEKLNDKITEIIDKISLDFLKNLYTLFEADNIAEVKSIMLTEEFSNISSYTTEITPAFYSTTSTSAAKSGKGVGIYARYVYYGDYVDNLRNGQGKWLLVLEDGDAIFDGQWETDKPNGEGTVVEMFPKPESAEGYVAIRETTSTYQNGISNGNIRYVWHMSTGEIHDFSGTTTEGFWNTIDSKGNVARCKNHEDYIFEDYVFPVSVFGFFNSEAQ